MAAVSCQRIALDRVTLVEAIRGVFARSPIFCGATLSEPRRGPGEAVTVEVSFDHGPPALRVTADSDEKVYVILHELASTMVEIERTHQFGGVGDAGNDNGFGQARRHGMTEGQRSQEPAWRSAHATPSANKESTMTCAKKHLTAKIAACVGLLLFATVTVGAKPALSAETQATQELVDKARLTLEAFAADSTMGPPLRNLLKRAQGVLVYPQVLRGAFIVGAGGGNGVFLVRDQKTNEWSGPAFYTMGQGSFGLQAGGDASEVVLVALTERGVNALLSTSAKLGGDVGVAVGPIGVGAEAATQNLSADIISYSRAKGLYAGASLEGAVVAPRDSLNAAYYGVGVTPKDILITRTARNPRATQLVEALEKATSSSRVAGS